MRSGVRFKLNQPKVVIILLNYCNWQDTVECIDSLQQITYSNYEIVLIENGSTDDSEAILRNRFPYIIMLQTGNNLGYTGGINVGMRHAMTMNSEYVLLLNNDTVVDPDFLTKLVEAMGQFPGAACSTGTIYYYPEKQRIWYAGGKMILWRGLAVHFTTTENTALHVVSGTKQVTFISGCLMLLRTSMIESIGFQDERFFMSLDDIEYSMRIQNKGYTLIYVPASIIYHKARGDSKSLFTLYYSIRNRLLFINTSLPPLFRHIAKIYFICVMTFKLFWWSLTNRIFFRIAWCALVDYFSGEFYRGRGLSTFISSGR